MKLCTWFKGEAERNYAMLGEDDEDRQRRELVDWIRAKGGRVTARYLRQSLNRYRQPKDIAQRALDDLFERGLGRWVSPRPGKSGGRPSDVFELNNNTNENETPPDEPKNGGIGGVGSVATSENTSEEKVGI